MLVVVTIVSMTTNIEHPSPEIAAAMSNEGVSNPDKRFSRMVDEFRPEPERDVSEVASPGFNQRSADALRDPATASAEQSSVQTPTGGPSQAAGGGTGPDILIWAAIAALLVLSIAIPPLAGGGSPGARHDHSAHERVKPRPLVSAVVAIATIPRQSANV